MAKRAVVKTEKATEKLLKLKTKDKKLKKLEIEESDEEVIIKKEAKPEIKDERGTNSNAGTYRKDDNSSSSSSESDMEKEPLTSPAPNKRKTPVKKSKKKVDVVSSDSEDVFMETPKKKTKKKPLPKTPKKGDKENTEKVGSPKTPTNKKTSSKKTKIATIEIEENSSDVELPLETPQKSLQKSEVIILTDSEDDSVLPNDINNNNNNNNDVEPSTKKKKSSKTEKSENKKKRPSLFEVLEPTKQSSTRGKGKEEEEKEEIEVEASKGKGKKKNKRRKKTWEDVARFARINFDTPAARTNSNQPTLSLSSSVNFSISSALDSMQGKKKKGRVMNKLAIPHKVPTLQYLCIDVLCNYIECVESFGVIPSEVQNSICALLAKKRKLNTNTLSLFLDPHSTSLNLTNISEMDPISLSRISECSLLKNLSLSGCGRLTDESLSIISRGCPNIVNIKLNGCYMITDLSLCDFIENHPLIEEILLGWITRFTSKFIKTLSQVCSKLRTIAFIHCSQLNDEMLGSLGALAYLENFKLEGNNLESITDVGICEVFTSSVELIKSVVLKGVPNVSDKGLVTMLAGSKQLKLLHLEGMSQLTDNGISHIAERAIYLDSLSIGRCANLTDPAVGLIATYCGKTLTRLSIEGLHNVTKKSLMEIPQYCVFLQELNLSWCRDADDELCQSLLEKCKNLRKLTLWGCHQVTDVMVGLLLNKGIDVIGKDQFLVTTA